MREPLKYMEPLVGKKLKEEIVKDRQPARSGEGYYIITRPDCYPDSVHINLYILFNKDRIITGFDWDKCRSANRGLYNRSAKTTSMELTMLDIRYWQNYIKENTEE